MEQELFSIRMRASAGGRHLSGAERIVRQDELDRTATELRSRALSKSRKPDRIVITIDVLPPGELPRERALPVRTLSVKDVQDARMTTVATLERAGVSRAAALEALVLLDRGPSVSGGTMRGAVIMNARTGKRLEPDQERGVRVSRFDWEPRSMPLVESRLAAMGLTHFRTREALALASKVACAPGMIAELCWSDDPDYTAGYVASAAEGYVRFPLLKSPGSTAGGRVFFVQGQDFDLQRCVEYLERSPVLITWSNQ